MNGIWIGVDGGGSKTRFAAMDCEGRVMAEVSGASAAYRQYGLEEVGRRMLEGVAKCMKAVGAEDGDIAGMCFGMPAYGEGERETALLRQTLEKSFSPPLYVCNDAEVGWAGSLGLQSGVNIVAGTGAIAFGRNDAGQTARVGGWCEFFGDEGSGYWVGRRAMEVFSKEADGRLPRSALYGLVREKFGLKNDFEFIGIVEREYAPFRDKTAGFQRMALSAAQAGDPACIRLYEMAAEELALCVRTLIEKLDMGNCARVSYSGGLFNAGELLLSPFRSRLQEMKCTLIEPRYSPAHGAALLAREHFQGA